MERTMSPVLSLLLSLVLSDSPKSSPRPPRRREARRHPAFRRPASRLRLEALEDRTVPTAVAAPSGLVSWWAGNGNAADSVGPNAGTLNNGVTFAPGEV